MDVAEAPLPSWEELLTLCREADAAGALSACCRRLAADSGWERAALLAAGGGRPGQVLATWGVPPEEVGAWAAGRPLLPLCCLGRVAAYACGEPGGARALGESPGLRELIALLAAGGGGPALLEPLRVAADEARETVAPLSGHPERFDLGTEAPQGRVPIAAGAEPGDRHGLRPAGWDPLFSALLPLVPALVVLTEGPEHRVRATNPLARARLGEALAPGRPLAPLLGGEVEMLAALDAALRGGGPVEGLVRDPGAGVGRLWSVAARSYGPVGNPEGLVVVATESLLAGDAAAASGPGEIAGSFFDACGTAMMLTSLPDLTVVRHNPAMLPLLGGDAARRGSAVGMRISEVIAAETWDQAGPALGEALATGRAIHLEELRAVFAGSTEERYYNWALAPVTAGGRVYILGSAIEVSTQVRARVALRARLEEAEGRLTGLQRALEAVADGVAVYDGRGILAWHNRAYPRLLPAGAPAQPFPGLDPVQRARRGEFTLSASVLLHQADGGGALEVSAWPLSGGREGAVLLLRPAGGDGEARRAAAEARLATRRSDALAAVIASLSEGVMITDAHGDALLVNRAYCALFGLEGVPRGMRERGAAVGLRRLDGSANPLEEWPVSRGLRGRTVAATRLGARRADGRGIVIEVSASPIREAGGAVAGCVCVVRDVTHEQHLQEERDDFISVAAHELRTPLTALLLEVQLLERGDARGEYPARWSANLRRLGASAARLKTLVEGLMDVGRLERGIVTLNCARCALEEVVAPPAERFRRLHPDHPLEVRTVPVAAEADPIRLEQVLDNLLDNAAKYCPPGTPIELTLEMAGGEALLAVADRGAGLPQADIDQLFTRYFRAAQHPANRLPGMGLGLYLARQIAELHGGSIAAANRPGGGLRVALRLPLAGKPPA